MPAKAIGSSGKRIKPVHKRTKRFIRHQSDRFNRVDPAWRKQKGIDSAMRRKFRGWPLMPNIGYGTARAHRNIHPDGFYHIPINTVSDLNMLLMQNHKFAAVIAHNVSARARTAINTRATQLNIKIVNKGARVRAQETA